MKTKTKPNTIIGYIPLYYSKAQISPKSTELDLIKLYINKAPKVHGCIWTEEQDQAIPILVMEKAQSVKSHIEYWSQGDPDNWFEAIISSNTKNYIIGITQKLDKTIERVNKHINYSSGKYEIIHHPLYFKTELTETWSKIRGKVRNAPITIKLLDPRDLNIDNISESLDKAITIGTFQIADRKISNSLLK